MVCSGNSVCENGGSCQENGSLRTCSCLHGTEGTFCDIITNCQELDCGIEGVCVYDITSQTGKCQCHDKKKSYDAEDKKCKSKYLYYLFQLLRSKFKVKEN